MNQLRRDLIDGCLAFRQMPGDAGLPQGCIGLAPGIYPW